MEYVRLAIMKDYGYTPKEWEEIDKQEKFLLLGKYQLDLERDNRIHKKMKENSKK